MFPILIRITSKQGASGEFAPSAISTASRSPFSQLRVWGGHVEGVPVAPVTYSLVSTPQLVGITQKRAECFSEMHRLGQRLTSLDSQSPRSPLHPQVALSKPSQLMAGAMTGMRHAAQVGEVLRLAQLCGRIWLFRALNPRP